MMYETIKGVVQLEKAGQHVKKQSHLCNTTLGTYCAFK